MPKPTAQQILARIAEMEEIRNQAEAAGDTEHVEKAVELLGILWMGFVERMGQPGRAPEEFETMYVRKH